MVSVNFFSIRSWTLALLLTLVLIAFVPAVVLACPACSKALEGTDVGAGFNASILFMIIMPFALVGVMAGGLSYRYRLLNRGNRGAISNGLELKESVE